MSLSKGTATCRIYAIDASEVPASFERTATMALRRYAFRSIDADRGEDHSFGWIDPRRVLDMALVWENMVDGSLVFLAVRIDKKTLDKVAFGARSKQRQAEMCRERAMSRLSRQQRLALEESLKTEMLREVSPTTSYVEIVWDRTAGLLIIGTSSNATCERITDLFASTFDVRVAPQFPSLLGYAYTQEQGIDDAPGGLPVLEAMERYGHLGPDFLTWILCRWIAGDEITTPSEPGLHIMFNGPITMAGVAEKVALQGDDCAGSPELLTALRQGKRVAKARVVLTAQENSWAFVLDAETFTFGSVKLPVPKIPDVNEYLTLRVQAMQHLRSVVHELFETFLPVRFDPTTWKSTVEAWAETEAAP